MNEKILWIGERDHHVLAILKEELPEGYDLLVPRQGTPTASELQQAAYILNGSGEISGKQLRQAPQLKLVQRLGAGLDGVDTRTARELGIAVANLPALNSVAVAEHTMLLALACARHLCALHHTTVSGHWSPNEQLRETFELNGRQFGIVGFGNIGREVARRAQAFGMNVRYFDIARAAADVESETGAAYAPLDTLLAFSDVLSIHVPLTADTAMLIGDRQLAAMKPGAVVVSVSRAGIVDEVALRQHLESGHIGAAGIDVWAQEPVCPDDPLLSAPHVIATPHSAAQTKDTVVRCFRAALANIERKRAETNNG